MPAPKRRYASSDLQAKMRKVDEDGEATPSISTPATDSRSLKTGNAQKRTVTPRAKKKQSTEVKERNKAAKSSCHSSKQKLPQKDSSKATSDPPVKKAKLFKATSASCGAASSKKAISKASLKRPASLCRTASTESDELSSEGSKIDLFKGRGDGEKSRCIRKYSNGVKGKRKATGLSPDLQNASQGSTASPTDSVQMDHNYGRCSTSPSSKIESEIEENDSKEFTESIAEPERQKDGGNETLSPLKESSDSVTGDVKPDMKSKGEIVENVQKEFTESIAEPERQKDGGNETQAPLKESSDSVTGDVKPDMKSKGEIEENVQKEFTESINEPESQKDGGNETPAPLKESSDSVTRDVKPDMKSKGEIEENVQKEFTESINEPESQKDGGNETQAPLKESSDSVTGDVKPDMKSKGEIEENVQKEFTESINEPERQKDGGNETLSPLKESSDSVIGDVKPDMKSKGEIEENVQKEFTESINEPERQKDGGNETLAPLKESSDSVTPDVKPDMKSKGEIEENVQKEFTESINEPERQKDGGNETLAPLKESSDSVTPDVKPDMKSKGEIEENVQKEFTESINEPERQNVSNETVASSKETPDPVTGDLQGEGETDEKEGVSESTSRPECLRDVIVETHASSKETSDSVPEMLIPGKKPESDGDEYESKGVTESISVSEGQRDVIIEHQALSKETIHNTASDQMLSDSKPEDNGEEKVMTTVSSSDPQSYRALDGKTQVTLEEISRSELIMQNKVTQEVPDTITNSCDGMMIISTSQVEEEERNEVTSVSTEPISGLGCSEQVQQSQGLQEVKEPIATPISEVTASCKADGEETERKVTFECVTVPESQKDMDVQTKVTIEERSDAVPEEEIQSLGNQVMDLQTKVTSDPVAEEEMQTQGNQEVSGDTTAICNEVQKGLAIVHSESTENERRGMTDADSATDVQGEVNVVSGSTEEISNSAPEQEMVYQELSEVKEDAAIISNDQFEIPVSSVEGQGEVNGRDEVVVPVCGHQGDINVVTQASTVEIPGSIPEPMRSIHQPEREINEIQVVYEAISSPESNIDVDERPDTIPPVDIQSNNTREVEDSTTICHNEVNMPEGANEDNDSNRVICVPDSQADLDIAVQTISVPESSSPVQIEQNNRVEEVKQVTVISSSDDINMPDSNSGDTEEKDESNGVKESISAPESSERVQEGYVHQEVIDSTMATTVTSEVEAPDSTSEDVIVLQLTSVPEEEMQMDIVTQAAAESGLPTSAPEQMNPDSTLEGELVESEMGLDLDSGPKRFLCEVEVLQCQGTDEMTEATETNSSQELTENLQTEPGADVTSPPLVVEDSNHCNQPLSDVEYLNIPEIEMTNSSARKSFEAQKEDCDVGVTGTIDDTLDILGPQAPHIVEDIEIGHCIVEVVGENEEEVDSDSEIKLTSGETPEAVSIKVSEHKGIEEKRTVDTQKKGPANSKQTKSVKAEDAKKAETPRKLEMNPQARTKARLAALAEQKAAASKKSVNRHQLNLLALCEEIADDIATDSMLLKRIEEEKQAAAAKAEAIKKECPPVTTQDADAVNIPTPAGPEECSPSAPPASESSAAKPPTADSTEAKAAAEPPKRRFFISQVTVPLKAHEKKKLTRYQRLRQVELQREKMSWTRVKKLKSDQASQMFLSDIEVKYPLFVSTPVTPPPVATPPPPVTSPSAPKTPVPDAASASKPTTPKAELPKAVIPKAGPTKAEPTKAEPTKAESTKAEPTKAEPTKAESTKAESTKADTAKEPPTQGPTRKVTRSATKRFLPAMPPPMPNGLTNQKPKPAVEYKPYRPRPKYSFDDFELDDDPAPAVQTKPWPQSRPTPQTRPNLQLKPTVPSQLTTQAKPNVQKTPVGSMSGQPKPTVSTTGQSKPIISTTPQSKPAVGATPQSKATVTAATHSKPVVSAKAQLRPAVLTTPQPKAVSPTGQSQPIGSTVPQSKPTSTPAAQLKPTGPTTVQPKPAGPTAVQPKPEGPTTVQTKPEGPTTVQTKPAGPTTVQTKPAGPTTVQTKPAGPTTVQPKSATTADTTPAVPKADVPSVTPKIQHPPSSNNGKCEDSTAPISSSPPQAPASSQSSAEPLKDSNDALNGEEKPAVTKIKPSSPEDEKDTRETETDEKTTERPSEHGVLRTQGNGTPLPDACLQKEVKKLKEADKDGNQTIIDAGQKHFGAVACGVCGMLYSAANPEDESQHLLFHNQFISAVKYVGWKKERILAEYPDGKIILVLPDDPKYALKKVEEIREMVDNDLGFQQVETKCPSQTKTFLFISNDKKVAGCLIAEHIQEGYRVIEDPVPEGSEGEKVMFERQRAWCCSTTPEPAICGISRIWVFSMMRRQGVASRMIECLRNNFIYGSCLSKGEIAFSDPTPDGKLFATHYFGTSQFLVYNFVSETRSSQPKTAAV